MNLTIYLFVDFVGIQLILVSYKSVQTGNSEMAEISGN